MLVSDFVRSFSMIDYFMIILIIIFLYFSIKVKGFEASSQVCRLNLHQISCVKNYKNLDFKNVGSKLS